MTAAAPTAGPPTIFVSAGEESGDILGAALMVELSRSLGPITFRGVGGARMAAAGLDSLFPMEAIQLHGLSEVLVRLPGLLRRIRTVADAALAAKPAVVILIDAPAFNLRVAKRIRRTNPTIPIVDYVAPSVWAWAPWRARRMAPIVDRVMAILPFEPEVMARLGGPPTTYVGHPLADRMPHLSPAASERTPPGAGRPVLVVLPGSRRSEVSRLMERFGETVSRVRDRAGEIELILPAVAHLADDIRERAKSWSVTPTIVVGEEARQRAFRRAHAALAASGTVTLELALADVPMVVAYRVDIFLRLLKPFLLAKSIVLANLVLGENAVPELLDSDATPERLADALVPLLNDTPERERQRAAFAVIRERVRMTGGAASRHAAEVVLAAMRKPAG